MEIEMDNKERDLVKLSNAKRVLDLQMAALGNEKALSIVLSEAKEPSIEMFGLWAVSDLQRCYQAIVRAIQLHAAKGFDGYLKKNPSVHKEKKKFVEETVPKQLGVNKTTGAKKTGAKVNA
jgi:hypothetical protein